MVFIQGDYILVKRHLQVSVLDIVTFSNHYHWYVLRVSTVEEFEKAKGIKISELDGSSQYNKRLRLELLVLLKDRVGLKYSEIVSYKPFKSLKLPSLGQLYKRMKKKTNN